MFLWKNNNKWWKNICYQANGVNWACCNPVFIIAHFSTFYERVNVVEVWRGGKKHERRMFIFLHQVLWIVCFLFDLQSIDVWECFCSIFFIDITRTWYFMSFLEIIEKVYFGKFIFSLQMLQQHQVCHYFHLFTVFSLAGYRKVRLVRLN